MHERDYLKYLQTTMTIIPTMTAIIRNPPTATATMIISVESKQNSHRKKKLYTSFTLHDLL